VVANCSNLVQELTSPRGFTPVTRDDQPSGEKVAE
jgi:hypothetical protein